MISSSVSSTIYEYSTNIEVTHIEVICSSGPRTPLQIVCNIGHYGFKSESTIVPERLKCKPVSSCHAGGPEGSDLDRCVPDSGDVCRPAGGYCSGGRSGRGHR